MIGAKSGTLALAAFLALLISDAALAADWPTDRKLSGNAFLTPGLLTLQNDTQNSPVSLWLDKGAALWADASVGPSCQSCHGAVETLKKSAVAFPRIISTPAGKANLINLEDQITTCSARGGREAFKVEEDEVLSLSALLHSAAKGQAIDVKADAKASAEHRHIWQARLSRGTQLFSTRLGRINLACIHCHDQNVGRQMRLDVVSPGHPLCPDLPHELAAPGQRGAAPARLLFGRAGSAARARPCGLARPGAVFESAGQRHGDRGAVDSQVARMQAILSIASYTNY